jgi:hypothetical protein
VCLIITYYTASYISAVHVWRIKENVEGSGREVIEVTFGSFSRGPEQSLQEHLSVWPFFRPRFEPNIPNYEPSSTWLWRDFCFRDFDFSFIYIYIGFLERDVYIIYLRLAEKLICLYWWINGLHSVWKKINYERYLGSQLLTSLLSYRQTYTLIYICTIGINEYL